jgi:putative endonuclease
MNTRNAGRAGEDLATAFLQAAGFRILARNVQLRRAELDLVALDGGCLVFVEVRLRRSGRFGSAAESVDARKQRRIAGAALELVARGGVPRMPRMRFDVVAIDASHDPPRISHIRDAFALR